MTWRTMVVKDRDVWPLIYGKIMEHDKPFVPVPKVLEQAFVDFKTT